MLTSLQCDVLVKVQAASRACRWWRAESSGQRVTLASLYRAGYLDRRAWRGEPGSADAANEYRISRPTFTVGPR